jgi:hypothetical protein
MKRTSVQVRARILAVGEPDAVGGKQHTSETSQQVIVGSAQHRYALPRISVGCHHKSSPPRPILACRV